MTGTMIPDNSTAAPEFRVFVSSTFRDMYAERDVLAGAVFPRLRRACLERGVQLVDIDLRWGITDAVGTRGIVEACLDEVILNRPIVIGIVGDRYGWCPAEEDLRGERLTATCPWLHNRTAERRSLVWLELVEGVLDNPAGPTATFFYIRQPRRSRDRANERTGEEREDREARMRLRQLKERIRASGMPSQPYLDAHDLGRRVLADLLEELERRHPLDVHASALDLERRSHAVFAESRRASYVEVGDYLDALDAYADASDDEGNPTPIAIVGASGTGKSALLAHWCARYRQRNPEVLMIEHYVGASPAGADHVALLRHLLAEVHELAGLQEAIPADAGELSAALPGAIERLRGRAIVVVIDALNQLDMASAGLAWLREGALPRGVRLVASAIEGSAPCDELRRRGWTMLTMRPLESAERAAIVRAYLTRFNKRLGRVPESKLAGAALAVTPLFLRTVLEELRIAAVHDDLNERIDAFTAAATLDELFGCVLDRLEAEPVNVRRGSLVREATCCILASRRGLRADELAAFCSVPPEAIDALVERMGAYLLRTGDLLTFFHEAFGNAVRSRYLPSPGLARRQHRRLAGHFAGMPLGRRRLDEQPWALLHARELAALERCLTDVPTFMMLSVDEREGELLRYWAALAPRRNPAAAYEGMLRRWEEARSRARERARERAELTARVGRFLQTVGEYGPARETLERALRLAGRLRGEREPLMAETLNRLATVCLGMNDLHRADELFRRAAEVARRMGPGAGVEPAFDLHILNNLGAVLFARGDIAGAEGRFREVWTLAQKRFGPNHALVVEALNNVGAARRAAGDQKGALRYFRRAVDIARELYGPDHPDLARTMGNLGTAYQNVGDVAGAESTLRAAHAVLLRYLGPEHPDTVTVLLNIGALLRATERFGEAERHIAEALRIRERTLGPDHPATATALSGLIELLIASGQLERALERFGRLLRLRRALFAEDHPLVRILVEKYADLLRRTGREDVDGLLRPG